MPDRAIRAASDRMAATATDQGRGSAVTPRLTHSTDLAALERRFRDLEARWTADTEFLSSYREIVGHSAFQAIVALGPDVVPFMLRDLQQRPRLWVWALSRITGENPIPDELAGNVREMSRIWLEWGRERGLLG